MRIITLLFCFLFLGHAMAQHVITGYVYDTSKRPLIGAVLRVAGTENAISTDFDGYFELRAPKGKVILEVSYVGYVTQRVKVKAKQDHLEIILEQEEALLDAIVISGRKDKKKRRETRKYKEEALARSKAETKEVVLGDASEYKRTLEAASGAETPPTPASSPSPKIMDDEYMDFGGDEMIWGEETAPSTGTGGTPAAGQLTAGILNDYGKWALWQDIQENELKEWQSTWVISPNERYPIQLTTAKGYPIVDAVVHLMDDGRRVWTARTDNLGRAELWANLYQEEQLGQYALQVEYQGQEYQMENIRDFQAGGNHQVLQVPCGIPQVVDIAFVVDATGSMGDEINYLKSELKDVISRSKKELHELELRLGSVFYRDLGDAYVTRKSHFSTDIQKTVDFIDQQGAAGGGDGPEAIEEALDETLGGLLWSESAAARLLFLVLDAPPHETDAIKERIRGQIEEAASRGIRIIPVACSGTGRSTEYLMRAMALATNGSYIYLTDDSGIGGSHLEPITDEVKVEMLNDLLVKTITDFAAAPDCSKPLDYANTEVSDTMSVQSKIIPGEGDADKNATFSWKYYPNPCAGLLQVEVQGPLEYLFLFSHTGKLLQRIPVDRLQFRIDLSQYPSGIYYLKGSVEEGEDVSGKIILIHDS